MESRHLSWPFFDAFHQAFAAEFREWTASELQEYENDEGANGIAAREIFQRLARGKLA